MVFRITKKASWVDDDNSHNLTFIHDFYLFLNWGEGRGVIVGVIIQIANNKSRKMKEKGKCLFFFMGSI